MAVASQQMTVVKIGQDTLAKKNIEDEQTVEATSAEGPEMNRLRVAQIYVRSDAEERESEHNKDSISSSSDEFNNINREFSAHKDMEQPVNEPKEEGRSESQTEFTYNSLAHYYRVKVQKDICSCRNVPSVLLEIIASTISIVNIAIAYVAFHEISEQTTGLKYTDYVEDGGVKLHGEAMQSYSAHVNQATIYIYEETIFINWKNFVYLGLSLIIIELLAPLLRVVVVTKRAPKKINTLHSLIQLSLLTTIVLEDGAVSLCKNMLFAEECGVRPAMMSMISQISCTLCFINSIFKSVLFMWRSSYRTTRQVRDEMEAYTEILILEDYQWYHCIIPILTHLTVICITIWSLVDATSPVFLCTFN